MTDVNITLQTLWGTGYLPWVGGKYPWGLKSEITSPQSAVSGFQQLWSDPYFPWNNDSFPWINLGVIGGTGIVITSQLIWDVGFLPWVTGKYIWKYVGELRTTDTIQTATDLTGTGDSINVNSIGTASLVRSITLNTNSYENVAAIKAKTAVGVPARVGGNIWEDIQTDSDSWTDISKPSAPTYNPITQPTETWNNI